jgi:uncharacterized membrane protein
VGEAFNWGWAKFQQNAGVIVLAALLYVAVLIVAEIIAFAIVGGIVAGTTTTNPTTGITTTSGGGAFASLLFGALLAFLFFALGAFLQAAIIRGALIIANGQRLEVGQMVRIENFGQVLIGAIIVGIGVAIGSIIIVGGIIVYFYTAFWLFFVIDRHMPAWDSIKASATLVNRNIGTVVVLLIGVIVAFIIGALLCGIGLIVTAPVALLALTFGYRRLQNEPIAA